MRVLFLIIFVFMLCSTVCFGQPFFQNPSFEGNPVASAAPPGWSICTGSPDVQPGFWGTTQTPSHGNTYLGFHHQESVSANFVNGIGNCSQISFEMDVSIVPLGLAGNSYWDANNQGVNDGYICIYGGYGSCDNTELLWQSPLITNVSNWQTLLVQLNPTQNYTYLNFVPCLNPYGTYTYFGIDNIVMIDQTPLVDPLTDAAYCEGDDISIDLSGGFSGSATFAWTGPNGFSSTDEDILIPSSSVANAGQYSVVVTDNGCSSEPVSAQINVVNCTPNVTCNLLCNTDFEDPQFNTPGSYATVDGSVVPCWSTTASNNLFEVMGVGFEGVIPYSGNQFIELNAQVVSTAYQDFQVLPGSTVEIAFAHRGRFGTDVMSVSVGPVGGPYTVLGTYSTGQAWQYYTVSYTFPAIPQVDYSIRFNSISAAGGNPSAGNFLDAISITLDQLTVDEVITHPSCASDTDGAIELTIVGGTPPYSIMWDAPISSSGLQVSGLGAGEYSLVVSDLYGCETRDTMELVSQFPNGQLSVSAAICDDDQFQLPGGTFVNSTGIYVDTLITVHGCDSIITTDLNVVDCTPNVTCNLLCNTDFEDQQVIGPGAFTLVNHSSVPCWSTTAADQLMEVWGTGFNGVPAYSGNQFIELNANLVSTIYQDFLALPGSTVEVSFAHRGRSGVDVMSVSIGPVGGPYVDLGTFSTNNTAWGFYTVSYTFPAIPQVDYSLRFNSVSAAGGSPTVGNFLDAISIIMPQLVVTPTVTDPTCTLSLDGEVDLAISGGTPPYTVLWDAPISSSSTIVTGLGDGNYGYTITDLYGCDHTDDVTLLHQFEEAQSASNQFICQGDQYILPGGMAVGAAGVYVDTLQTVNGCDSVVTTDLTVHPTFAFTDAVSICDGETHLLPTGASVSAGGVYADTLQTVNGCDSIITTELTVNPSPVVTDLVSICYGQSYLAQGSWQTMAGTYFDTLSTPFGCDSVIITELSIEPIIIHTIDTLMCVGDSVFTGGNWKTAIGIYGDTLITPIGCDSLLITNVGNHPQPNAAISVQNSCLDELLTITDASTVAGGSIAAWQWNLGNNTTSNQQQPAPQSYPAAGIYTVELVVQSDVGCVDSTEADVQIYPLPMALFTFDSVCHNELISFTDQSTPGGPYPITQWSWVFSDQQTSNLQDPTRLFAAPGPYSATLTITTSVGCKADTTMGDALVFPNPVAVIDPVSGHCLHQTVLLTESSTVDPQWGDAIVAWEWELDGTAYPSPTASHVFSSAGMQPVTLSVLTNNGCSHEGTMNVEVFARPQVALSLSRVEGCEPLDVVYVDESTIASPYAVSSWNWVLGNGQTSTEQQPTLVHNHVGSSGIDPDTLEVALSVGSSQGCASMDTATATIVVFPLPDAAYEADPPQTDMVDPKIAFRNASSLNAVEWNWTFGDGQISVQEDPVHTYADTGLYDVVLQVLTAYGCTDITQGTVLVKPHFSYYIPNAFTPNMDGRDDLFRGEGEGYTSPKLWVFNRWGDEIYYGEENGAVWDGLFRGSPVEVGVYVYVISVTDHEGNERYFRGHVSLLR